MTHLVSGVSGLVSLAFFAVTLWAVVDAALRPAPAYVAAGKLTKPAWLAILVVALLVGFGLGLFGLVALVAVIVYFVDVRPALREIGRGGSSSGPYGPWR